MKRYSIDLVAGTPVPVTVGGEFFLVDSAPSPVQVEFFGSNGAKREEELSAAQSADWASPEKGFASIRLTSAVNQTMTFYVSRGRTGSNRGAYDVTDRAARLLGIVYGNLGQLAQAALVGVNAQYVTERGAPFASKFSSTAALAAGATEQVFAAASNTQGAVIVRAASWEFSSAGGATATETHLHAHTAAPAAFGDGDMIMPAGIDNFTHTAGFMSAGSKLERLVLATGRGVWFRNNGTAATSAARRSVLYTL